MRSWSYHLLALFVVLCWGMTLVSSKVLLNFGMQPWALVELRSVLAYGILIFLAPMQLYSGTMRGEITVALLGLTSIPLFFGLQTLALEHGVVSTTASLIAMGPLLSGLLAMAALRTWKLHWMTFLGICTAATGTFRFTLTTPFCRTCRGLGFISALPQPLPTPCIHWSYERLLICPPFSSCASPRATASWGRCLFT